MEVLINWRVLMQRSGRKPGEPIYLKRHILGLILAVALPILLPLLYHHYIRPLSFAVQFVAALIIALVGSLVLYFSYRASAQNEP
jgi:VIT1/CCC1 family predicted Fe2+/Mn2+ transporter